MVRSQTPVKEATVTKKLFPPGIRTLHAETASVFGEAMANLIKSQPGLISFTYVVGSHIEVVLANN